MANEQRLINANTLPVTTLTDGEYWTKDVVYKRDIDEAPTIDAAEVVHGQWVSAEQKPHLIYKCSECGDMWSYGAMLHCNYCPNCGAKMDGEPNG